MINPLILLAANDAAKRLFLRLSIPNNNGGSGGASVRMAGVQ
ncbi:hypothetical protein [Arsenophonus sp. ENCA]|nr:hypothetical protein [Arsenophonus sp. ENCA]